MFTFLILAVIGCQFANAKSINDKSFGRKVLCFAEQASKNR